MRNTREPTPRRLRSAQLRAAPSIRAAAAGGLLAAALLAAACDDEPVAPEAQPLAGSRPELERWVVHLKGEPPDPAPYREALEKSPEQVPEIAEKLRQKAMQARAGFVQRIADLGGRVVDHWWLTNAVTVEIPGGNVPTLKVLDEVERVEPDRLLDE